MDNLFFTFVLLIILVITIFIIYVFFNIFMKVPEEQKLMYHLNHPQYVVGKNNCPQGCYQGNCIYPNNCFNCDKDDPYCCCTDDDCKNC